MEALADGRGRWVEHNLERQSRIVRAAIELIEAEDSSDFAIQDIANRAGLSKSVVYRQFEGRDELDRRVRSQIADDLLTTLVSNLDFSNGSVNRIARRTINAIADWTELHPKLYMFLRSGPSGDLNVSAVGSLKDEVAVQIADVVNAIAAMIGADARPFQSLPYALVTMVEGTLTRWVADESSNRTRDEIIEDLAMYTGFLFDGAARRIGLELDQDEDLLTMISRLAGRAQAAP